VERKLIAMLGEPTESPYGNPIPAMEEIGGPKSEGFLVGVVRATELGADGEHRGILRRIGEPAQFDPELLKRFQLAGVIPGARVTVQLTPEGYRIETDGPQGVIVVPEDIAHHLYLAA